MLGKKNKKQNRPTSSNRKSLWTINVPSLCGGKLSSDHEFVAQRVIKHYLKETFLLFEVFAI